jgi:hypothetical protein
VLAVIDGNPGLSAALEVQWPNLAIQCCTNHKLWNLLAKAPAHLREELAEDSRRMIYAPTREAVEQALIAFTRQWQLRCKAVSASFTEAGDELFTFIALPMSQWKAPAHHQGAGADQRGVPPADQTQASLPSQEAVLFLLFEPLRSGQITLCRLVGWPDLTIVSAQPRGSIVAN